ncbi:MAG: type III secretion system export apparatus subunit SctS [Candidatus Competibacteraceae bacterium]|jgi:type III secretion protein S|nr:type III secretion system export apparatus subunit SctS [Candidatus Competibacteraceae bacterium]
MNDEDIIFHASQALVLVLQLSLPVIIAATLVGLLVGLFQALTQIQEQTLPFGFKLVAVVITLLVTARWFGIELQTFTINMFNLLSSVPL